MVYDYNGNGVDSQGRLERKEKSTGRLSSAIGPGAWVRISALQKTRIIKLLRAGDRAQSKALGLVLSISCLDVEK